MRFCRRESPCSFRPLFARLAPVNRHTVPVAAVQQVKTRRTIAFRKNRYRLVFLVFPSLSLPILNRGKHRVFRHSKSKPIDKSFNLRLILLRFKAFSLNFRFFLRIFPPIRKRRYFVVFHRIPPSIVPYVYLVTAFRRRNSLAIFLSIAASSRAVIHDGILPPPQ